MTDFIGQDLAGSVFDDVYLTGARFHDIDLGGADFRQVDLTVALGSAGPAARRDAQRAQRPARP